MSDAETLIHAEIGLYQRAADKFWGGDAQRAVTAICRALDMYAASARWGLTASVHYGLLGAVNALTPFLDRASETAGPLPWGPSPAFEIDVANGYLEACGKLSHLERLAALARFGLTEVSIASVDRISIRTLHGSIELALRAIDRESRRGKAPANPGGEHPERRSRRIARRLTQFVDSYGGWFIRYDNDMKLVREYRRDAQLYGRRYMEKEAFPDDVVLGDRSFGQWRDACDQAVGRILCHMDFAAALVRKRPSIELHNILTIYARKEDVAAVWQEAGMPGSMVGATMRALTLGSEQLKEWRRAYEIPTHYYVGLGQDFVLMPCFGALTNPYYSMFRHLRNAYRPDWDRGVDRRENVFRAELAAFLPTPRFLVQERGYKLRRSDGSIATDIDAVAIDRASGRVALFQLKWHDIFGRSLSEREIRKRNMATAATWVDTVARILEGLTSAEVCQRLGIACAAGRHPPVLIVLARYMARFSGDGQPDPRATWLAWPEFRSAFSAADPNDPLASVGQKADEYRSSFAGPAGSPLHETLAFRGLTIDLEVVV